MKTSGLGNKTERKPAEIKFSVAARKTRAAFLLSQYARLHEYAKIHRGVPTAHFSAEQWGPVEKEKKATR